MLQIIHCYDLKFSDFTLLLLIYSVNSSHYYLIIVLKTILNTLNCNYSPDTHKHYTSIIIKK